LTAKVAPSVYLDTGIFVAFLSRQDRWHTQAVALFGEPPRRWYTSSFVVAETYSFLLHRAGEETARGFLEMKDQLTGLVCLVPDADHEEKVRKVLGRLRGSKLTYVDASSLVFLEQTKIRRVWSTDHHLGLTGAEVLPVT